MLNKLAILHNVKKKVKKRTYLESSTLPGSEPAPPPLREEEVQELYTTRPLCHFIIRVYIPDHNPRRF